MKKVGFIGWRGMVGSVLLNRMLEEKDFSGYEPVFFSTSQKGQKGPDIGIEIPLLQDAYDIKQLSNMDIIVTCQGGDYTTEIYKKLRDSGWKGYWIDAASTLRMADHTVIVLDPINKKVIDESLKKGIKDYIGGNCTVSLLLMAIGGLFEAGLVEWITTMTYQAASGAGAKNMQELVKQMLTIGKASETLLNKPDLAILELDKLVKDTINSKDFPIENFGAPLAGSLIPWIDKAMENGQTREEWKGMAEANKILQTKKPIPIDGICVRIGAMRCHSQAFTIKLTKDISLKEIEDIIKSSNQWVRVVPNEKEKTLKELTPAFVTGTLNVPVGRLRKMTLGPQYLTGFTVGDQLLWGAAEPLRRVLKIILDFIK
ncbi:MAG TPA: aspartate-semialdehyde dehydrogenase [Spirochaetota bacterium]|nr:aspartate-semialdehyde dehydrogenase [Spirochaetota bacterium]HOL58206.1 aspartate-semialdehyde dehydrogenase [Spirochaetota bacterium]